MSDSAWCGSNSIGTFLKLHDKWPNVTRDCRKQLIFSSRQFKLEKRFYKNLKNYGDGENLG